MSRSDPHPALTSELTPKELRFVEEYLIDLNATRAFLASGYKAKDNETASIYAYRLVRKPPVAKAIRDAISKRTFNSKVKAERVIRELAYIGLADPTDVLDFDRDVPVMRPAKDIPEHARRTISSMKVKTVVDKTAHGTVPSQILEIKFWDKNAALEKLCRHLGLFAADKDPLPAPSTSGKLLIDELELSLDVRKALLAAIKKRDEAKAASTEK